MTAVQHHENKTQRSATDTDRHKSFIASGGPQLTRCPDSPGNGRIETDSVDVRRDRACVVDFVAVGPSRYRVRVRRSARRRFAPHATRHHVRRTESVRVE